MNVAKFWRGGAILVVCALCLHFSSSLDAQVRRYTATCFTTMMDAARFRLVPQLRLSAAEIIHNARNQADLVKASDPVQRLFGRIDHEFILMWVDSYYSGGIKQIEEALRDHNKSRMLNRFLSELVEFSHDAPEVIARAKRKDPQFFKVFESTPRSWADWWNVYQFYKRSRNNIRTRDPSVATIVFDSNIYMADEGSRDHPSRLIDRILDDATQKYQYAVMPENVAEAGDERTLGRPDLGIVMNRQFTNSYDELSEFFRRTRVEHMRSTRQNIPEAETDVIGDDRLLAQVLMSGADFFMTRDHNLFESLKMLPRARVASTTIGGKKVDYVEFKIKVKDVEHKLKVVILNPDGRRVSRSGGLLGGLRRAPESPSPAPGQILPIEQQRQDFEEPVLGSLQTPQPIDTDDFKSWWREINSSTSERAEIWSDGEDQYLIVNPSLLSSAYESLKERYIFTPAQEDAIQIELESQGNHGFYRTSSSGFGLQNLRERDFHFISDDLGQDRLMVLRVRPNANFEELDEEKLIEDLIAFEELMGTIFIRRDQKLSGSEKEMLSRIAAASPKAIAFLQENRGLKPSFIGGLEEHVNRTNVVSKEFREIFDRAVDHVFGRTRENSDHEVLSFKTETNRFHSMPEFSKLIDGLSESQSSQIATEWKVHTSFEDELQDLNPRTKNLILDQIRMIAEGQSASNVPFGFPGLPNAIFRSVERTHILVAVKTPSGEIRVVGVFKYTQLQETRGLETLRERVRQLEQ